MSATASISTHAARLPMMLTELRLPSIKRLWPSLAAQSDREGWAAEKLLAVLLEHEIAEHGDLMTDYAVRFPTAMREQAGDAGLLEEFMLQAQVYEPVGALTYPPAWTIRSSAERSTTRSLTIGNPLARHGSTSMTSPFRSISNRHSTGSSE